MAHRLFEADNEMILFLTIINLTAGIISGNWRSKSLYLNKEDNLPGFPHQAYGTAYRHKDDSNLARSKLVSFFGLLSTFFT